MTGPVVAGAWRLLEWGFGPRQVQGWIEERLALGIDHFDLADVHGDARVERAFGQALTGAPGLRQRLRIVCTAGLRQPNTRRALPDPATLPPGLADPVSLQAEMDRLQAVLGPEPIDLLLLQCPGPRPDEATLDTLAATLQAWQQEGRVRALGASHWPADALASLHRRVPLLAHQLEVSLLQPQALTQGTLAATQALGLQALAWSPLAGGRLVNGSDTAAQAARQALANLADATGATPVALACAWLAGLPAAPRPVIGARRLEVVHEALAGSTLVLAPAQRQALDALARRLARPAGA